jgi:hypothetical protein
MKEKKCVQKHNHEPTSKNQFFNSHNDERSPKVNNFKRSILNLDVSLICVLKATKLVPKLCDDDTSNDTDRVYWYVRVRMKGFLFIAAQNGLETWWVR